MYRIDDATASATLPTPEAALTEGYWTEGNPATGVAATLERASWFNMVQEELRAIVVAGAITPSKTVYNQVLSALKVLFAPLAGNATQVFSVAAAIAAAQAVNLGQFPATLAASGSATIPTLSGNLIIKWGAASIPVTSGVAVTFPTAFTSGLYALFVTPNDAGTTNSYKVSATNAALNGFTAVSSNSANATSVYWFAIGK